MPSFWDAFTGRAAARDIRRGQQTGLSDIGTGEAGALDEFRSGIGVLDPYATGGREGYEAYLASLGLRGDDARRTFQDNYFNDPVNNALMDRVTRANTRRFTGIGMGNSGAATQSLTNALLEGYRGWQDRFRGLGEGGVAAAGGQAGLYQHAGDTRFGAGQQRAAVNMNAANALAQSRGIGINNLLATAGTVARFVNPRANMPRTS